MNNEPAFPCSSNACPQGMTYRQWLIGKISPAMIEVLYTNVNQSQIAEAIINIVDEIISAENCEMQLPWEESGNENQKNN